LPENQRIAVVLQRYGGLSYQQIADVMRTSMAAVESLLFRAKHTLRKKLSSYVEDEH
jgi:RNA polymerase sigma-70 factor (ECF subfamily)